MPAFRVQPPEIVVPEDDPFRNDLLGRDTLSLGVADRFRCV